MHQVWCLHPSLTWCQGWDRVSKRKHGCLCSWALIPGRAALIQITLIDFYCRTQDTGSPPLLYGSLREVLVQKQHSCCVLEMISSCIWGSSEGKRRSLGLERRDVAMVEQTAAVCFPFLLPSSFLTKHDCWVPLYPKRKIYAAKTWRNQSWLPWSL